MTIGNLNKKVAKNKYNPLWGRVTLGGWSMESTPGVVGPRVLVLAGGGIDSTVCMHLLHQQSQSFRALHVNYGQRASTPEWKAVQALASRFGANSEQITLTSAKPFTPGEVVGRNAAFISLALMNLLPTENIICIGIHSGTPFFDCSQRFFDLSAQLIAEQTDSRIRLIAPLLSLTKPEIVEFSRRENVPIELTYSCQEGVVGGCGHCHSCLDRRRLEC